MELSSRSDAENGHILISGTGRAGTTLLVQYFTALGFDTGYTLEQCLAEPDAVSHGGLERSLGPRMPYVAKSPYYMELLGPALARGAIKVQCCIIPMRDLFSAAESRRRVFRQALSIGLDPKRHPGTVWKTSNPTEQEEKLAVQFYNLLHTLCYYNVPTYMLRFPSFAQNPDELCERLQPLLSIHGVTADESHAALSKVFRSELVHQFSQAAPS